MKPSSLWPRIVSDALVRVRAEYLEMPGLRLTVEQVTRLCGVERDACQTVLDVLVDAKFLCMKPDRSYVRLTDGDLGRPQPARVVLITEDRSLKVS